MRAELAPEDIWQETLAMAWRDRATHEWRGKRAFRAWLLGIAKNRVHDAADRIKALKRGGDQRVDRFSELEQLADASVSKLLPPGSTTPSRIASDAERARVMREALAALPRELETVLRLRLFEELPMREVATRIGIGLTTANERFFKAAGIYHERLRALLGTGSSDRPERS